jgi:SAM-dependent methyltransferase
LIAKWTAGTAGVLLKTDLFEEAYGSDQLLFELDAHCEIALALDLSPTTVSRARERRPSGCGALFLATDVRHVALQSRSVDLVISTSTLDHFPSRGDFELALAELARILRPGGQLIITVDNSRNPLYWPLRWLSRTGFAPYPLGYTPSPSGLVRCLRSAGLEAVATGWLIHNPRMISTALFLLIRRVLGDHADGPIRSLLRLFAALGRLPARNLTACFFAVSARKPSAPGSDHGEANR